jgi:hypothetical protein
MIVPGVSFCLGAHKNVVASKSRFGFVERLLVFLIAALVCFAVVRLILSLFS